MKYRIIVLIIIIISLAQIILSDGKHVTHACTHAHTCTHLRERTGPPTHRRPHPGCRCYVGGVHPTMTKISPLFAMILDVFHVKKSLGRTETRTHERMYCQSIRTVRDISRDGRPAVCKHRQTDRQTYLRRIIV